MATVIVAVGMEERKHRPHRSPLEEFLTTVRGQVQGPGVVGGQENAFAPQANDIFQAPCVPFVNEKASRGWHTNLICLFWRHFQ